MEKFSWTIRWLIRGIAAAFVAVGAPAWAQSTLDAQALKLYGGTYLSDCSIRRLIADV